MLKICGGKRTAMLLAFTLGFSIGRARAAESPTFQAVTEQITYNVGASVRIRIIGSPELARPVRLVALVRYQRANEAGAPPPAARSVLYTSSRSSQGYLPLWTIPASAQTGRYSVDLRAQDPVSGRALGGRINVASFAVHRKLVRIDRIDLGKIFYTSGDRVRARVEIANLTNHPLHGLRVEFSDRYWPWIAGPEANARASIVPLATSLNLPAGTGRAAIRIVTGDRVAVAPKVEQPSLHQYGVVVWDHERRQVLDIAFSRIVFVDPPGTRTPKIYPGQYTYPGLDDVNVKSYRHFYPVGQDWGSIAFNHEHTLFTPGVTAAVSFGLTDTGSRAWSGVQVHAHLTKVTTEEAKVEAAANDIATQTVAEHLNLDPGAAPLAESASFRLPDEPGLYSVEVRVESPAGDVLAHNNLELAVNPLPKSIMIFCAHEDDEDGWDGMIRAAVENHVPVHFVYFTSGDAGSCDHYYERSCGPAEALNFGGIRMDETRAVLGHLGVAASDILFLGLPDGGSGEIWYRHPSNPYLAPLLASDHAPYASIAVPNLPYARDAVVSAAASLIRRFSPETIITAHPPAEGHIDHIVNNYFTVRALQNLAREGAVPPSLKLLVDRVYDPKELPPAPYNYEERVFYVSGEAAALAQEAGWYYQSQGANRAEGNLRDFDQLSRKTPYREVVDWNQHQSWNNKEPQVAAGP